MIKTALSSQLSPLPHLELAKFVLASGPLYLLFHFLENPSLIYACGPLPHLMQVSAVDHLHRHLSRPCCKIAHYHATLLSPPDMRVDIY